MLLPLAAIFLLPCLVPFSPVGSSLMPPLVINQELPAAVDGDDGPAIYIVHVRKPEQLLTAGPEEVEEWHKSFLPTRALDSGKPRMLASYKVVISGFAAWLTAEELRAMSAKEGFLHAEPDREVVPQTTYSPDYLGLRPDVWQDANRGEGAIIAVIDTGIRPDHVSFVGSVLAKPPAGWNGWCYFDGQPVCNDKILGATFFETDEQKVLPPDDDVGHGTHVAGTIAGLEIPGANVRGSAAGTASGAAPGAYLAVYRVDTDWQLLWSIEKAIKDGVHVISMSLGTEPPVGEAVPPFYGSAIAVGSLAAVRRGIVVSCAACNSGPSLSSVCNDAPWIMTVGASTLDRNLRLNLRLGNGAVEIPGESLYGGPVIRAALVFPGIGGDAEVEVCSNLDGFDLDGKVVMCYAEIPKSKNQADRIREAGGVAMVIMNNEVEGSIVVEIPDTSIPTVAINYAGALQLIEYVNTTSRRARDHVELVPVGTITGVPSSPAVPHFSGRGPSLVNGGILKPDILGPGVNILAAEANSTSEFVFKTGTSMATPHLSGIAAIVKLFQEQEAGLAWTPAMVRSALMTTATLKNREGLDITDETDQPADLFITGAGQVNATGAMDPGLVYDIQFNDYVRYLCGLGYTDAEVLQTAFIDVNCDEVGKLDAEQLNYPTISVTVSYAVKRKVVKRTATNVQSRASTYTAEVSFPAAGNMIVSVSPETLQFSEMGEEQSFEVTFALVDGAQVEPGVVINGELKWVRDTPGPAVTSPLLVTIG